MAVERQSVCYVASSYSPSAHTAHLPRFLQELSKYADVHVVLWSHTGEPSFPGVASVSLLASERRNRLLRLFAVIKLAMKLRRRGCRVFFVRQQVTVAIVLSFVRKLIGIKVLLWRSGLHEYTGPSEGSGLRHLARVLKWRFYWKFVFPFSGRVVNRFVTGPASMIEYYHKGYGISPDKTILLDNDVNVAALTAMAGPSVRDDVRARLGIPDGAEVMIYVGRVDSLNLGDGEMLVQVADSVLSNRPAARLILVGRVTFPGLVAKLRSFSWGDRVHVTDSVPFEEAAGYFVAADVAVFPVIAAGFPRVVLEAMALGAPFVTTDRGGVPDLVTEEQEPYVVEWGDVVGFVRGVMTILDDKELHRALQSVGRQRVQAFSTDVVARCFVDKIIDPYSHPGST
jgi:glycosyltransferase involved in cell wall biosynthesis